MRLRNDKKYVLTYLLDDLSNRSNRKLKELRGTNPRLKRLLNPLAVGAVPVKLTPPLTAAVLTTIFLLKDFPRVPQTHLSPKILPIALPTHPQAPPTNIKTRMPRTIPPVEMEAGAEDLHTKTDLERT